MTESLWPVDLYVNGDYYRSFKTWQGARIANGKLLRLEDTIATHIVEGRYPAMVHKWYDHSRLRLCGVMIPKRSTPNDARRRGGSGQSVPGGADSSPQCAAG